VLEQLFVWPAWRSYGLARRLVEYAIADAKVQGFTNIFDRRFCRAD
jgi:GNAT superfamily N-acetyltransferase